MTHNRKIRLFHVLLCGGVLLAASAIALAQDDLPEVDAKALHAWEAEGKAYTVLDVREAEEQEDYGHVPDSVMIPAWIPQESGQPQIDPAFDEKVRAAVAAEAVIVILDYNEWLERRAGAHLQSLGYTQLYVFSNGAIGARMGRESPEYLPGWIASDLPWIDGEKSYGVYSTDEKVTIVDADTVRQWMKAGENFIIVDVRRPNELEEFGKPEGSINIPLFIHVERDGQQESLQDPDFAAKVREQTAKYDKLIMICTLSWRAGIAGDVLQQAGMKNVYVFKDGIQGRVDGHGITKGWRAHGLPYIEAEKKESGK